MLGNEGEVRHVGWPHHILHFRKLNIGQGPGKLNNNDRSPSKSSVHEIVGRSIGQSVNWLVHQLVSPSFGRSVNWSISPLVGRSNGRSNSWSVTWLVGQLVGRSISQLVGRSNWLVGQGWSVGQLVGRSIGWLVKLTSSVERRTASLRLRLSATDSRFLRRIYHRSLEAALSLLSRSSDSSPQPTKEVMKE